MKSVTPSGRSGVLRDERRRHTVASLGRAVG